MSNTVLIVDDAYFMRNLLKKALKEAGYEVIGEAKNGKEGIKFYFELKPDIVTMDINMPDITGIEATKQILSKDPNAKIIAVTGNNDDDIKRQIFEAGVKDYLQKPFQPAFLLNKIEKMLEEQYVEDSPEEIVVTEKTNEPVVTPSKNPTVVVVSGGDEVDIEDGFDDVEFEIMNKPDPTKTITIEVNNEKDSIEFPTDYKEVVADENEKFTLTKQKVEQLNDEELIDLVPNTSLNVKESSEEQFIEIETTEDVNAPFAIRPPTQVNVEEPKAPIKQIKPVRQPEIKQPSRVNSESINRPVESLVSTVEITKSKQQGKKIEEINIRPKTYVPSSGRDEVNIRPPRGKILRDNDDRDGSNEVEEPILNDSSESNYNDKNNGLLSIVKRLFTK